MTRATSTNARTNAQRFSLLTGLFIDNRRPNIPRLALRRYRYWTISQFPDPHYCKSPTAFRCNERRRYRQSPRQRLGRTIHPGACRQPEGNQAPTGPWAPNRHMRETLGYWHFFQPKHPGISPQFGPGYLTVDYKTSGSSIKRTELKRLVLCATWPRLFIIRRIILHIPSQFFSHGEYWLLSELNL